MTPAAPRRRATTPTPSGTQTTTVTTTVTQTVTTPGPSGTVTVTRTVQGAPAGRDRCVIPPGKRFTLTLRATKNIRKGAQIRLRVGRDG